MFKTMVDRLIRNESIDDNNNNNDKLKLQHSQKRRIVENLYLAQAIRNSHSSLSTFVFPGTSPRYSSIDFPSDSVASKCRRCRLGFLFMS